MTQLEIKAKEDAEIKHTGQYWQDAHALGYVRGYKQCRAEVVAELLNLAAQTEDPRLMALAIHFEKLGED